MDAQFLLSLVTGMFIGGTSGCLGALMLTRRMALVAGPLGHLTLPGVALATLYGFNVSLGAFPFVIFGIVAIWWLETKSRLPMEALTAIVFASGVAITFLFLPIQQAEVALVGDISRVTLWEAIASVAICAVLFAVVRRIFRQLVLATVAEDLAYVEGINVGKCNLIYLTLIAVIVALGVKVVGGLLTAALVAIPAAAARNASRSVEQYARTSMAIGSLSSLSGIVLSKFILFPAGPLIILVSTLIFLVALFRKRSHA
jgi:ABC-type Mn2+/Zn2+ transport system permease subunit